MNSPTAVIDGITIVRRYKFALALLKLSQNSQTTQSRTSQSQLSAPSYPKLAVLS
jgi:hypothetical protein